MRESRALLSTRSTTTSPTWSSAAHRGGVFKSTNAGNSWTPIFDNYGAASIGDVKILNWLQSATR
jgi:hypothetical protein